MIGILALLLGCSVLTTISSTPIQLLAAIAIVVLAWAFAEWLVPSG